MANFEEKWSILFLKFVKYLINICIVFVVKRNIAYNQLINQFIYLQCPINGVVQLEVGIIRKCEIKDDLISDFLSS